MKTIAILICFLATSAGFFARSSTAHAWDGPTQWYESASGGPGGAAGPGGGGIIGTGGALDHNITCAHCHVKGDAAYGTVDFKPTFNPPLGASYKLGQTYEVTIAMTGEHLGKSGCMNGMKNVNQWAATFEDDSGKLAGAMAASYGSTASCPASMPQSFSGPTHMSNDCHAIIGRADDNATTSWTFSWTAPTVSTPVTLYYGGVDGDCTMNSLMDDVKVGTVKLGGGVATRLPTSSSNRALALFGLFPAIGVVAAVRGRNRLRKSG